MRKLFLGFVALLISVVVASPTMAQGSVLDLAASSEDFSILVAAIEAANPSVAERLSSGGNITVLAPNNTAFENLSSFLGIRLEDLLLQPELLTELLLYHVIDGSLSSSQIAAQFDGAVVPTLLEGTFVNFDVQDDTGQLLVNDVVEIVQADLNVSNGVVHVINDVLLNRVINERIDNTDFSVPGVNVSTAAEGTNVRFVHSAADAPAVDVYINEELALANVSFGDISDFVTLTAGTYSVALVPAGRTVSEAVIGPADFALAEATFTTVAVLGSVEAGTLNAAVFTDDYAGSADQGRLVLLHAIEGAPDVDVVSGDTVLASSLSFSNFSSVDLPAGTYDLNITLAGDPDTILLEVSDFVIEAGGYYLAAAIGTPDTPGISAASVDMRAFARLLALAETGGGTEIDDLVAAQDRFQLLLESANAADPAVLDTLGQSGPFTLFAPSNQALRDFLATIGASSINEIDPDTLTQVLLYHVVEGAFSAEDVVSFDGQSVETLLDEEFIALSIVDGSVVLNGLVTVSETDIIADNGVIHIIDAVLLPAAVIEALGL